MARKKAEETINLDSILFKCRDILRKARNSGSFFEERDKAMIDTISDPEFPTYRFYVRLREYYEDLKRRIAPKGEDLFDLF